ncbi:MAG: phosphoglucosamine mutase [Sedimentisphaerales bacterium]|nr:phosphoglucosamine mutase [Sedimentisphaerales bacterium]
MPEQLIISISGMRGIIGENLTASIAAEYGSAFGTFLKDSAGSNGSRLSVCIGRDSRGSGRMLASAVGAGLCGVGVDVVDVGLVPTPTVGVMVTHLGCAGGVIITASHNPIQYNGIKLLLGNSMAPPVDAAGRIKQFFLEKRFDYVDSARCGGVAFSDEADAKHIERVLAIADKEAIAAKGFRVVLDSVNGAGGPITRKLLAELGCQVSAINDEPTGVFAHTPEPIAENLTNLCEVVKAEGAEIGFAQDPDADRLAIVDEAGTYIGEEYTLAMAAKYIFSKKVGKAATNLSTSRMIDDIAAKAGCQVIRTPVGEANVASAMLENDCVIGGEGNGGIIDLRVGPIRDSLAGIALVLQLMAETGRSVSQLTADIGSYYMTKTKFAADSKQAMEILKLAKQQFSDARLDVSDGYRFDFEDGWVHIRSSNTEPVMRAIVEAKDRSIVQRYLGEIAKIRREVLG